MTRVLHHDRIAVRWDASTLRVNADKTMTVDGIGAHVGNMTYHDDQGRPFVEYVPASTLFDQPSMESSEGGTLTISHGPGLITPETYRDETHGTWVKSWEVDGKHLGVRVRLKSPEAIRFVSDAMNAQPPRSVELSPTYEVDVIDTPGDTEHGHHDAVQRDRRYSGIAMLGPDEARGGPGTKLKLDGPVCAPKGARVQVITAGRLDSAPRVALHSETGRSNTMKHATIRSDGFKPRKITAKQLEGLRTITSKDAIETGTVTIAIEGEETSELVLPTSMIEMLLEGIGASSAAPEPEPMEEEMVEMAAADMDDPENLDAKLDAKIEAMVTRKLAQLDSKRQIADARDIAVKGDAATILPPSPLYDYSVSWQQVALDAIAKAKPELETEARKLAKDAKTDPERAGMLRQMLANHRQAPSDTPTTMVTKGDSSEGSKPWHADTMPTGEKQ